MSKISNLSKRMTRAVTTLAAVAVFAALAFALGGCYTKLATHQGDNVSARFGECRGDECWEDVPASTLRQREVCVWERDMLGFPHMRCYNTNYFSSWVYFHHTPWWYRDRYHWSASRRCPPHYFFDHLSGVCRYRNTWGGGGGGGGGSGGSAADAPSKSRFPARPADRARDPEPDLEPATSSTMFSPGGGGRLISPAPSPIPQPSAPPSSGSGTTDSPPDNNQGGSATPPAQNEPPRKGRFTAPPRERRQEQQNETNGSNRQDNNRQDNNRQDNNRENDPPRRRSR